MHKLFSISAAMLAMAITFEGASPASAASVTCTSAGDYTCSAGTAGGCARAIRKLKELDNTSDEPIGSLSMIAGAGQMPPMSQMSIAVGFMQRFDPVNFDVITETMENGELRVTVFPVGSDRPVMRRTAKASPCALWTEHTGCPCQ